MFTKMTVNSNEISGTTVSKFDPKTGTDTVIKFTPGHQADSTRDFNSGVAIPQRNTITIDMSKVAEAQAWAISISAALTEK